jgi:hypothetical protein
MYLREVFDKKYGHNTNSHVVKHKDDNDKDFWAVYNEAGDIVKVFYSAKEAKDYAEKNHDDLMKNKIVAEKKKRMNEENYRPRDYEAALRQTDVGKDTPSYMQAAFALSLASQGEELSDEQQVALGPYVKLFSMLLLNPRYRSRIHTMINLTKGKSAKKDD